LLTFPGIAVSALCCDSCRLALLPGLNNGGGGCDGRTGGREGAGPYNYPHFDGYVAARGDLADEAAFWASPRAGRWAPDFTLPWLGGGAGVRLSDLWRSKPLVMEFGSFT